MSAFYFDTEGKEIKRTDTLFEMINWVYNYHEKEASVFDEIHHITEEGVYKYHVAILDEDHWLYLFSAKPMEEEE